MGEQVLPAVVYGRLPDGREVLRHHLSGAGGIELTVIELGATLATLSLPTRSGARNVVLGHPDLATYLASSDYLGATIGRYANRIAGGRFSIGETEHVLPTNDRGNHLHGGPGGFHCQLWSVHAASSTSLELELESPAGDQGYPGALRSTVRYDVGEREVTILLTATTDAVTPVSLTNHTYFNLEGEASGSVDRQLLTLCCDTYLPVGDTGLPLGTLEPVDGTPFDLRSPTQIGPRVRVGHPEVSRARGLDHPFIVRGDGMRLAATLASPGRGITLTVHSDQPSIQVYTGNVLDGSGRGTSGSLYRQGSGVALETQQLPDAPNRPRFPSTLLAPGQEYRSLTRWVFGGTDLQVTPRIRQPGRRGA